MFPFTEKMIHRLKDYREKGMRKVALEPGGRKRRQTARVTGYEYTGYVWSGK